MFQTYRTPRETLRLLPAALLLSLAGLPVIGPAVAAEVRYDPGDKVYFTYCHSQSTGRADQLGGLGDHDHA